MNNTKIWARYVVVGHRCSVGDCVHGHSKPVFFASTLQTAQGFQGAWGGDVKSIREYNGQQ